MKGRVEVCFGLLGILVGTWWTKVGGVPCGRFVDLWFFHTLCRFAPWFD